MPFLKPASGAPLHYLDENSNALQAVLLLHGLGADSSSWQLQVPALIGAGFRVIVPDAPGFGQSPYPGRYTSIKDFTAPIAVLLERLQTGTVHAVGISMGGTLALQLALEWPQQVDRLVLVSTFARLNLSEACLWPYLLLRFVLIHTLGLPTQARAVANRVFPHPDQEFLREELISQIVQADPHGYRAAMRALARFNELARLNEVKCRTMVVTGEEDTTVPAENQKDLVKGIPNARQVIVPGAGHAISVEKHELFNEILLEFLSD